MSYEEYVDEVMEYFRDMEDLEDYEIDDYFASRRVLAILEDDYEDYLEDPDRGWDNPRRTAEYLSIIY